MFVYNLTMTEKQKHPSIVWKQDARQQLPAGGWSLRLAAMAGHMRVDAVSARRTALVDLLTDGRPHPREEIWETIAGRLGLQKVADCWGKLPQEALARDLAALRKGGLRIAYSRRPGVTGLLPATPPLHRPGGQQYAAINWELIHHLRRLSVPEKNKRAFAAADFALRQKKLLPELLGMIAERIYLPFDERRRAAFITPTAIIVAKLRAYAESQSTCHLDDIVSIVRLQGKKLDQRNLDAAAGRLGLLGLWRAIWQDNQPPN